MKSQTQSPIQLKRHLARYAMMLSMLMVVVSSCKKEDPPPPPDPCAEANTNGEWGYTEHGGPACWAEVCSHGECTGDAQSPINVTGWATGTTPTVSSIGGLTETHIMNNGHTLKFEVDPGMFISYGLTANGWSNEATLGQFHFHANSEHQVSGNYSPLEIHFVHREIWGEGYIVISVLVTAGAENAVLQPFIANLPTTEGSTYNDAATYNPYALLPSNLSHYAYTGSLTTPPCSEVVTWLVMENKIEASQAQIDAIKAIIGENFRSVQPLNSRTISYVVQ